MRFAARRSLSASAAALLVGALSLVGRAQGIPTRRPVPAPRPGAPAGPAAVALAPPVRSLRVLRSGEVIRVGPDAGSPRRGTAERDALLPALEFAAGPGCHARWVRVEREAWMCTDELQPSAAPPRARPEPVVPEGEVVPYAYAFALRPGVATFRRLEDVASDDWAEQLERGMGVAVTASARLDGQTYARTAAGRWIALRDLAFARPSAREGLRYEPGEPLQGVGFLRAAARPFATPEDALAQRRAGAQGVLPARAPVHLREEQLLRGRRFVRTDAGWLPAGLVARPDVPAPPAPLAPGERWVDVDTARQVLVAFEGPRPVFATLVSTGTPAHATRPGTFRVWIKLATSDMSNADDPNLDSAARTYGLERVPWVLYFNGDQALHGAYWHDRFGARRSHGCVNLAPRDARWLFDWAPPALPPGWNAVFPTRAEPGLLVRVR